MTKAERDLVAGAGVGAGGDKEMKIWGGWGVRAQRGVHLQGWAPPQALAWTLNSSLSVCVPLDGAPISRSGPRNVTSARSCGAGIQRFGQPLDGPPASLKLRDPVLPDLFPCSIEDHAAHHSSGSRGLAVSLLDAPASVSSP